MAKCRVLIVGGTGYLGRRLVKASLAHGHTTYVLHRPEIGVDIDKLQMLLSYKEQGVYLVEGSFNDRKSLVDAVKLVDVVICAISGVHIRSHQILLQLELVEAIKEAGNVKRFLPSEFGTDPARMADAMEPGRVTFDDKMVVRKAIEDAGIPFTYVSANCFAGYFVGGLCQPGKITPSKESVVLLGDGNQKAIYVDEDDIASYTIKSIDDYRTLNKTLYLRPPLNILSQREVVGIWEKLIGKVLDKSSLSSEEFLAIMKSQDYAEQVGLTHYYHICYEGCLANFDIHREGEEATNLYPDVKYTTVEEYLKRRYWYLGKRIVKASLIHGNETYVLQRLEIGYDIDKLYELFSSKEQGTHLVHGSFSDHQSLVDAVKLVDVVICTISGVHMRSHHKLLQLKLVDAIKRSWKY